MNIRESSQEAYDALKTEPMAQQQRQILAAVRLLIRTGAHTDGYVSRRQVAHLLEMETSTVAARVNALIAANRLTEDDRLRKCPLTHRNVHMISLPQPVDEEVA